MKQYLTICCATLLLTACNTTGKAHKRGDNHDNGTHTYNPNLLKPKKENGRQYGSNNHSNGTTLARQPIISAVSEVVAKPAATTPEPTAPEPTAPKPKLAAKPTATIPKPATSKPKPVSMPQRPKRSVALKLIADTFGTATLTKDGKILIPEYVKSLDELNGVVINGNTIIIDKEDTLITTSSIANNKKLYFHPQKFSSISASLDTSTTSNNDDFNYRTQFANIPNKGSTTYIGKAIGFNDGKNDFVKGTVELAVDFTNAGKNEMEYDNVGNAKFRVRGTITREDKKKVYLNGNIDNYGGKARYKFFAHINDANGNTLSNNGSGEGYFYGPNGEEVAGKVEFTYYVRDNTNKRPKLNPHNTRIRKVKLDQYSMSFAATKRN